MDEMLAKMKAKMGETDNAMDLNVDDELLELEEEVFGKKKSKKKKKKKEDDSLDLSDLDDEDVEEKPKKKERSNKKELELDDELAALEKEGFLDVEDDDSENEQKKEEKKEVKKEEKKEEKKELKKEEKKEVKNESKKEIKKEEKKEIKKEEKKEVKKESKKEIKNEEKNDIYQEKTEKIYHVIDKMKCISVLQNEIEICEQIVKYKINNKFDDEDIWENKKALVKVRFNNYTTFVEEGTISIEDYFKMINDELIYEKTLLSLITKDKGLKEFEIPELKNRINKRIELINSEIGQLKESMGGEKEEELKTEETKPIEANPEEAKQIETNPEEAKQLETNPEKTKPVEEKKEETKPVEVKKEEIKKEEEENSEYSKEELESLNLVKKRLEQYKQGINYAKANDFQYGDLINELKKLNDAKKLIESHNFKEDDMKKIPSSINPEIVFGYSIKERLIKYKELIEGLFKQRTHLRYELDLKLEEAKKLPKTKLKKEQGKIKEFLDKKKNLIEKCDKQLKLVKANLQDNWVPIPLFIKEEKTETIEKINKEIPASSINIFIGKLLEYKHSKNTLFIELKIDLKKELKATIEENKERNFDKLIKFEIDKTEFKHLYSRELTIELKTKGFFKNHVEETIQIKLAKLKNDIKIEDEYKLLNNNKNARLEVKIEIRNPCVGQVFEEKTIVYYQITKMFPSFKIYLLENLNKNKKADNEKEKKEVIEKPKETIQEVKKPESQNIQKPKNNPPQNQKPIQKKVENKQTENKESGNNSEIEKIKKMPEIDKNKFKPEELDDPDIIDNLVSVSVLENKDKELDEKIKKIETRIPRPLREKSNRIKVKITFLKNALGDTISPQDYVNIMKNQLEHDKLLYYYFVQKNENEKANIVKHRIQILIKELNETETFIKQGGGE